MKNNFNLILRKNIQDAFLNIDKSIKKYGLPMLSLKKSKSNKIDFSSKYRL